MYESTNVRIYEWANGRISESAMGAVRMDRERRGFVVNRVLIVLVLSALASLWPALRATQITVREALAYE